MDQVDRNARRLKWTHYGMAALMWTGLGLVAVLQADDGKKASEEKKSGPSLKNPASMEVRFTDNSNMKLVVKDDKLELDTAYGRLVIPFSDVRQIDFGTRLSAEAAKRIDAALANLGSSQFRTRASASAELLSLGAKAYPALLQAAQQSDPEVVRRAEELLARIREAVPEELLEVRHHDVVYTDDMKVAGWINRTALQVSTFQFGEQQLKFADLHSLRSLAAGGLEGDPKHVLSDPGNLNNYQNQLGKTFLFRVTGAANGSLWGTNTYTSDSALALAAVHAGVLRSGQTGVVKVTIVPPPMNFQGSTKNGVTSAAYGPYQGAFKIGR